MRIAAEWIKYRNERKNEKEPKIKTVVKMELGEEFVSEFHLPVEVILSQSVVIFYFFPYSCFLILNNFFFLFDWIKSYVYHRAVLLLLLLFVWLFKILHYINFSTFVFVFFVSLVLLLILNEIIPRDNIEYSMYIGGKIEQRKEEKKN